MSVVSLSARSNRSMSSGATSKSPRNKIRPPIDGGADGHPRDISPSYVTPYEHSPICLREQSLTSSYDPNRFSREPTLASDIPPVAELSETPRSVPMRAPRAVGPGGGTQKLYSVDEAQFRRILREELSEFLGKPQEIPRLREGAPEIPPRLPSPFQAVPDGAAAFQNGISSGDKVVETSSMIHSADTRVGFTDAAEEVLDELDEDALQVTRFLDVDKTDANLIDKFIVLPQAAKILELLGIVMHLEEPARSGTLYKIVEGPFDKLSTLVIIMNVVFTFFKSNYEVQHEGQSTGTIQGFEVAFVLFYTLELVLKLCVHGLYFFCNDNWNWNTFDFLLVLVGLYGQIFVAIFATASTGVQLTFLRGLRMLKLVKALRVFRLIRAVDVLRMMLNAIMGSLVNLLWSLIMLIIIFYMFAVVTVQFATAYLADGIDANTDLDAREELLEKFGSVQTAMLGFFVATTGGDDWINYYDALEVAGRAAQALYLFCVAFSQIALMNILTGIFVEHAMELAKPDHQAVVAHEMRLMRRQAKQLEEIIRELDTTNSGYLSEDVFHREIRQRDSRLRCFMAAMGIHEADAVHFFHMLRSAKFGQQVEIHHLVGGIMKLRGDVQNLDMQGLIVEMKVVHKLIHDLHRENRKTQRYVERSLGAFEKQAFVPHEPKELEHAGIVAAHSQLATPRTWQC